MNYQPSYLVVPVGSTVSFILVNGADPNHPIAFNPPLNFNVTFSGKDVINTYTFTKPGIYRYYCATHGNDGSVVVQ
jgi:plastocyanin